ncbi:MAG: hypothetical protein CMF62_01730 [Magnetococcales bacterium]|nr:hypothetical protein [Magnetococcales bacterium]|tara:strand:- start:73683 stop:74231 length:549 start_codon:yes stop_codon:yes gene_type:complete
MACRQISNFEDTCWVEYLGVIYHYNKDAKSYVDVLKNHLPIDYLLSLEYKPTEHHVENVNSQPIEKCHKKVFFEFADYKQESAKKKTYNTQKKFNTEKKIRRREMNKKKKNVELKRRIARKNKYNTCYEELDISDFDDDWDEHDWEYYNSFFILDLYDDSNHLDLIPIKHPDETWADYFNGW